jgi:tetratricopeptide (TPR) repeat protein
VDLSGEQAYFFRHAVMRDVAYTLQPPAARAHLHRLALQILETLPGLNTAAVGIELRDHARLALAGQWPAATVTELRNAERKYLRLGADYARFNYDYGTALAGFGELIELLADNPHEAAMVADQLADVYQRLGRWQDARECFVRVQRDCTEPEYVGRALLHLAWMDLESGQGSQAQEWARQCEQATEQSDSYRLRIALLMFRARERLHAGNSAAGLALQESAIRLAVDKGDGVQEMIGHGNAAEIELNRGELISARRHAERALELSQGTRMQHHRASALLVCAHIALEQQDWQGAGLLAGEALQIARRTGSRALEGSALVVASHVRCGLGNPAPALAQLEAVKEIWHETGDRTLEHSYYIAWAGAMREAGRAAEAVVELERAAARLLGQLPPTLLTELDEAISACRAD